MAELIDREELRKFPIRIDHYDKENGKLDFVFGIETVFEYIEYLPTIEAKPVVRAHWKRKNNEMKCSNCEFIYYSNHDDFNFCPNCGAQMDEVVFTAENPVVAEKIITDPPVATEEEKEKYLNKEIDYIKSYKIEEEN